MRIKTKFISSAILVILSTTVLSLGRAALLTRAEQAATADMRLNREVENAIIDTHLALQSEVSLITQFLLAEPRISPIDSYHAIEGDFNQSVTILEETMISRDSLAASRLSSLRRRHQQLATLASHIFEQGSFSLGESRQLLRTLQTHQTENTIYLAELFDSVESWDVALDQTLQRLQTRSLMLEGGSLFLILLLVVLHYRWLFMPLFQAIKTLQQGAETFGKGGLDHRLYVSTKDELAQLANTFNLMAQQLEDSYANLEKTVAKRTVALTTTLDELQRTQSQLIHTEKMSSLGQLVAGIAHEINNPVSFIAGNLEPAAAYSQTLISLLRQCQSECAALSPRLVADLEAADLEFIAADYPKLLQSMETGVTRITRIIDALRIFSRLDESAHKQVDLHDSLNSILTLLKGRLRDHGRGVIVRKEYGDIPPIACYSSQLNQVFMHILTNAIDAFSVPEASLPEASAIPGTGNLSIASGGPPTITIRTTTVRTLSAEPITGEIKSKLMDPSHVLITISDNGPGIPQGIRQRIFDPFFSNKPVGKGVGLGLSTSYQIVSGLHGGRLDYRDTPGGGATFNIYLPVVDPLMLESSKSSV